MDLRSWRKAKGLTLEDLADPLGCSKSQLARIEKGETETTRATMRKIFEFTEGAVTPNDLVGIGETVTAQEAAA